MISKKNGLSILVCKDHSHKDLAMQYFRLPKNPYCSPFSKLIPKIFVTCSVEPNIMSHAVLSIYNTSTLKVNTIGGYFGLSIFSITGKSSIEKVYHGKGTISHVHAVIECPEIIESLMH